MSNLKHLTVAELEMNKERCEERIKNLRSQLAGAEQRLKWIKRYIFEKTPQEMTIRQIERKLGHKIIIQEEL